MYLNKNYFFGIFEIAAYIRNIVIFLIITYCFRLLQNYMEGDGRLKTKDVFNHYVCAAAEEEKHAYVSL